MLTHLEYWHWFVIAVVFITFEIFVTTSFFIWVGIAAGVVGVLLLLIPSMSWEYQWLIFALVSLITITAWWIYQKKNPSSSEHPTLNRRGQQYVGRHFTLTEPVVDGVGKIKVDDTMWKIIGEDCAVGSKVKVTAVDGVMLKVELIDKPVDQ